MTEDQKVEILVEIERMLARDNISALRVLKKSLLDINNTQILEAAQEIQSAFFWANVWIVIAVIVFAFTLSLTIKQVYLSAKKELFESVNTIASTVALELEPMAKELSANSKEIQKYSNIMHEHTLYVSSSVEYLKKSLEKKTSEINAKTQEMIEQIEMVANDSYGAIKASKKIQQALEEEIVANKILRGKIAKQGRQIEKKDREIEVLHGAGYKQ